MLTGRDDEHDTPQSFQHSVDITPVEIRIGTPLDQPQHVSQQQHDQRRHKQHVADSR
jgi:hypothetical protein